MVSILTLLRKPSEDSEEERKSFSVLTKQTGLFSFLTLDQYSCNLVSEGHCARHVAYTSFFLMSIYKATFTHFFGW